MFESCLAIASYFVFGLNAWLFCLFVRLGLMRGCFAYWRSGRSGLMCGCVAYRRSELRAKEAGCRESIHKYFRDVSQILDSWNKELAVTSKKELFADFQPIRTVVLLQSVLGCTLCWFAFAEGYAAKRDGKCILELHLRD